MITRHRYGETTWVDGDALVTVRDTFDKLLRAVDLVDELREPVSVELYRVFKRRDWL